MASVGLLTNRSSLVCQAVGDSDRFLFLRNASLQVPENLRFRALVKLISCANQSKRDCNSLCLCCARCGPMQCVLVLRDPVVCCRGALQLRVCLSSCLCMCVSVFVCLSASVSVAIALCLSLSLVVVVSVCMCISVPCVRVGVCGAVCVCTRVQN